MSALGEVTLIQHLADRESLGTLVREGFDAKIMPSEDLRKIYVFAVEYFHQAGRTVAPSVQTLRQHFGEMLDDHEIDITYEPEDSIEWAIDDLKGSYVHLRGQEFLRDTATNLAKADAAEKPGVLSGAVTEMMNVLLDIEDRSVRADYRSAMKDRLAAYEERALDRDHIYGMRLGLEEFDMHSRGIHPGELAVLAAAPKVGKSMLAAHVAYHEWMAGRTPVLFTLENSVEMTLDRLVAIATNIDSRGWAQGTLDENEKRLAIEHITQAGEAGHPLWVLQPDLGQRSFTFMVREALIRGADSIIIDQLSFVELGGHGNRPQWERIGDALHLLRSQIATGRNRVPVLLCHQINREGVDASRKENKLRMEHMAGSAEIERTSDWVLGIYRNDQQKQMGFATFSVLAARREEPKAWNLGWSMGRGQISVIEETSSG